ncbi:MAG TPA: hypothetical protein VJJ02_00565 [Candidatus Paceibacterota bacterium]
MRRCMISVPKEVKPSEGRVGVVPDDVRTLRSLGVLVGVEHGAGLLSGFSDEEYRSAGATIFHQVEDLYREADVIVKVKEPTPMEYPLLAHLRGKTIFTYLHLAGVDPELTKLLLSHEITAIAYENVTATVDGRTTYPLLVPMSRIAGTQAMRGALLRHPKEYHRKLKVVILGCGVVGESALEEALANSVDSIAVFESREERRAELEFKYRTKLSVSFLPFLALDTFGRVKLNQAEVVISGVMNPGGAAAPKVLTQKHFRRMRKGCYIADVAIDQGGSTAWSKVTKPGETFTKGKNSLVFSCVPNIPGSTVPREATEALTKATFPFVSLLGEHLLQHGNIGIHWLLKEHLDLRGGLQTFRGHLVNSAVASRHQLSGVYMPPDRLF